LLAYSSCEIILVIEFIIINHKNTTIMKLIYASALLFLISCNSSGDKETIKMPGAYKMSSSNVKTDKTDSTYTNGHQLKIYTDGYMMYANVNSPDSLSGFGVGTYSIENDTITERVIFNAYDSTKSSGTSIFTLAIEKTVKGYKQVIADMVGQDGQHNKLTEEYESVGTTTTSPLDGAWKQTSSFTVNGKDTSSNINNQYKTYYSGHVIWGHNYTDSLNKIHTGIGFGKFVMKGTDKVTESMEASTYYQVRGNDVDIDIEMKGTDQFKQTITNPDGSKNVEIYQRLK